MNENSKIAAVIRSEGQLTLDIGALVDPAIKRASLVEQVEGGAPMVAQAVSYGADFHVKFANTGPPPGLMDRIGDGVTGFADKIGPRNLIGGAAGAVGAGLLSRLMHSRRAYEGKDDYKKRRNRNTLGAALLGGIAGGVLPPALKATTGVDVYEKAREAGDSVVSGARELMGGASDAPSADPNAVPESRSKVTPATVDKGLGAAAGAVASRGISKGLDARASTPSPTLTRDRANAARNLANARADLRASGGGAGREAWRKIRNEGTRFSNRRIAPFLDVQNRPDNAPTRPHPNPAARDAARAGIADAKRSLRTNAAAHRAAGTPLRGFRHHAVRTGRAGAMITLGSILANRLGLVQGTLGAKPGDQLKPQ